MQTVEQMKDTLETLKAREPKNPTLKDKALYVIDALLANEPPPTLGTLAAIYRYAHVARGVCLNPHNAWKSELNKAYKRLKEY